MSGRRERADAPGLAEVYAAAWREAYAGIIPALTLERMIVRRSAGWWRDIMKKRAILVLEVGGAVAGYATFAPAPGRAHAGAAEIQELYLKPEYQGIGLGMRLFSAALKRIKEQAVTAACLSGRSPTTTGPTASTFAAAAG